MMNPIRFGKLELTESKGWNNRLVCQSIFDPSETFRYKSVAVSITGKDVARFPILTQGRGPTDVEIGIYPAPTGSPNKTFLKVARSLQGMGNVGFSNLFPVRKQEFQEIMTLIHETPKMPVARKYELLRHLLKEALNLIPGVGQEVHPRGTRIV